MTVEKEHVQPVGYEEIGARVRDLNLEGMVDLKAEIDVNNHTSPRDLMVVLNHSLKLRQEGGYELLEHYSPDNSEGYVLPEFAKSF